MPSYKKQLETIQVAYVEWCCDDNAPYPSDALLAALDASLTPEAHNKIAQAWREYYAEHDNTAR